MRVGGKDGGEKVLCHQIVPYHQKFCPESMWIFFILDNDILRKWLKE